jgi:tryptophan-rich sensory protein
MLKRDVITVVVFCAILLAIAGGESFIVKSGMDWYQTLQKPIFNPPGWVFGPVWTLLYILMAVSFFIVWKSGAQNAKGKTAIACFIFQLVFNFLWTPIFFGLKQPFIALGDIVILWLAVLATMSSFFRVSKTAGALLVPYFLWISFAAILNGAICMLNQ